MKIKSSAIYCIENTVTGMMYIGQTISLKKRFREHKNELKRNIHKNTHFQNSWNFHGIENFVFYPLEFCDREELNFKESFYINSLGTLHPNGYNLIDRGSSTTISDETRKKMSERALERFSVPSNHPFYGRKVTEESKKKNSESNKKRVYKDEWKKAVKENTPRGEECHSSKLSISDVKEIKEKIGELKDVELAKKYGVSVTCIWKIRTGRSWV